MPKNHPLKTLLASACLVFTAAGVAPSLAATETGAVIKTYGQIGLAKFTDTLETARTLNEAVNALIAEPSKKTLDAARKAWIAARIPYQQTEAYRFGNPVVDDWEGRLNAWPLDEGLIDYVDPSYGSESDQNSLYTADVIANPEIKINGKPVDASSITPEFLSSTLHEAGNIEANVATGYHAIEFLLWGQDLNGTNAGAGNRPFTDYAKGADCTNGNCDRRGDYLSAVTQLLVADLEEMVANWTDGGAAIGYIDGLENGAAISAMLTGMGSLSYGELAGERMKLGLILHDPEEEQDCFSDNTQASHLNDAIGIRNVYLGNYVRVNGTEISGPSLSDLVREKDADLDNEMRAKLDTTIEAMVKLNERAASGEAYDQQIAEGNIEGNAGVQAAIDALIDQTRSIERVIATLDLGAIELEGSESLDNPDAIFQ